MILVIKALSTFLAFCSLALLSCDIPAGVDYYAELVESCQYMSHRDFWSQYDDMDPEFTSLTDDCKEALSALVPFDDNFDRDAPAGTKDKVLEGFQILIGYPLAIPSQNSILGIPCRIPDSILKILAPETMNGNCYLPAPVESDESLNRNLVNRLLNNVDRITWEYSDSKTTAAQFQILNGERVMTIQPSFWNTDTVRSPFSRAATLIHEGRHGDGFTHQACPNQNGESASNWSCDAQLDGPYGYQAVFQEMLMHGSWPISYSGSGFFMSYLDAQRITKRICRNLREKQLNLNGALGKLVEPYGKDCEDFTAAEYFELTGLTVQF